MSRFQSEIDDCPIESIRIVEKRQEGTYRAYQGQDIYLDHSQSLVVSAMFLRSIQDATLFLEASSSTAATFAYLPLIFKVYNSAPIFTAPIPANISVDLNETLVLPSIVDFEGHSFEVSIRGNPEWMELKNGSISGLSQNGQYPIEIVIEDIMGMNQTYSLLIIIGQKEDDIRYSF